MIKKDNQMRVKVNEHMRDGDGSVIQKLILDENDMAKHSRVFSSFTINKGCSIGLHTHYKETEYYYILKGEGVVYENNKSSKVYPGDLVITKDQESHSISNECDEPLELLAIIILD